MPANDWDAQAYDRTFGFVSRYGADLIALLDARAGEAVLDLGCGTGQHAALLAASGVRVLGVDADPRMLEKARADHPEVAFVEADARSITLTSLARQEPFDACLSNAALHWMTPQDVVLRNVRSVLRTGGRFVAEMGGAGNIDALDVSFREALDDLGLVGIPLVSNYFPTAGAQASLLEDSSFRVEDVSWFRRPTPLGDGVTAADWTRHFRAASWDAVPVTQHDRLARAVNARAQDRGLHAESGWWADYCRLRFVAIAT